MIVDVAFVNMRCQHIGVLPLQHFIGKLLSDLMGLFRRGLAGGKGLYQVVSQIIALLVRLRQQHFKFYALCELVKAIYIEAPDKSSGKRRQNIRISYDLVGFIPVEELLKQETA